MKVNNPSRVGIEPQNFVVTGERYMSTPRRSSQCSLIILLKNKYSFCFTNKLEVELKVLTHAKYAVTS